MTDWNFADVWEEVAAARPDAPAIAQGPRRYSWRDFDRRADGIASGLLRAGLARQSKVAQFLYNGPEYLESLFAAFKVGMVPVNTNYRYTAEELEYLWDNADVEAVVFDASLAERVEPVRDRLHRIKTWLCVDDGSRRCPPWADNYEEAAGSPPPATVKAGWGRSGDDLIFIYTGGTTGMPKGVMWRQDDLFVTLNRTGELRYAEHDGITGVRAALAAPSKYPPARLLPGPPLMHGTGLFTAMSVLNSAGSVVLLESRHFDVQMLLDTVQSERITEMSIVGDAFAKPILSALDANPDRWDISSVWLMISSGVMWSAEVKQGLLRHQPKLLMVDNLGSSEAIGLARSASKQGSAPSTAGFHLGADTRVIDESSGTDVEPGSGQQGMLALRGRGPIGYYKDPEKSAATFRVVNGERWTIPGDFATVEADGTVRLLGRGSVCINTGGEKVFPEEVEEVLKRHPAVHDAVVVGVPDERFGEAVAALIEPSAGSDVPDGDELSAWARHSLAGYKVPRHIVTVETIGRAANGKVDYKRLRAVAEANVGGGAT